MNTRHTPGPWFATALRKQGADPSKDGCDIGADNGSNVAIALHQASDRTDSETVANARMIAAAPDLLAALQALVEHGTDSPQHRAAEAAIARAEQSRAKLTGGS